MPLIKDGDTLVKSVSLYREKHWLYHAYVLPFAVLYAIWFHAWLTEDFRGASPEVGMIILAVIFILQVVIVLACHWSVHVMAFVTCTKVTRDFASATFAKFVPTVNNGSPELLRIKRSGLDTWVIFQKLKYIWSDERKQFESLEFPVDKKLIHYLRSTGYEDEASLEERKRLFGTNK